MTAATSNTGREGSRGANARAIHSLIFVGVIEARAIAPVEGLRRGAPGEDGVVILQLNVEVIELEGTCTLSGAMLLPLRNRQRVSTAHGDRARVLETSIDRRGVCDRSKRT